MTTTVARSECSHVLRHFAGVNLSDKSEAWTDATGGYPQLDTNVHEWVLAACELPQCHCIRQSHKTGPRDAATFKWLCLR